LAPSPGSRVYYAAFGAPIDFADCYAPPAVETLTDRILDAGLDVQFLETKPYLETAADLADVLTGVRAVGASGGELLVNYRPDDALPVNGEADAETEVRDAIDGVVDVSETRFEPQVGETFAGRAGNTATHLLESEATSVGITRPEAAFLARPAIDGGAMKLRSTDAVLGPAPAGRVYYAAFGAPIDFADCYAPPAVETLTDRILDAGLDVQFLDSKPYLETAADLADVLTSVRARRKADALVPPALADWVDEADLVVERADDGLTVSR
ncbi:hypothetical protein BRD11_03260, partial [Halobacteriales archaeon SW_12_69_24]